MGLDTSHDCWHGSYGAFNRWRTKIAEVAGFGALDDHEGFGGTKEWPKGHALTPLLHHSDCEGEIAWEDCGKIADTLEALLPMLETAGDGQGHIGMYADKTRTFITGLRAAHSAKENVEFH